MCYYSRIHICLLEYEKKSMLVCNVYSSSLHSLSLQVSAYVSVKFCLFLCSRHLMWLSLELNICWICFSTSCTRKDGKHVYVTSSALFFFLFEWFFMASDTVLLLNSVSLKCCSRVKLTQIYCEQRLYWFTYQNVH